MVSRVQPPVPSEGSPFHSHGIPFSMIPAETRPPFGPMTTFLQIVPAETYPPFPREQPLLNSGS